MDSFEHALSSLNLQSDEPMEKALETIDFLHDNLEFRKKDIQEIYGRSPEEIFQSGFFSQSYDLSCLLKTILDREDIKSEFKVLYGQNAPKESGVLGDIETYIILDLEDIRPVIDPFNREIRVEEDILKEYEPVAELKSSEDASIEDIKKIEG